MRTLTEWLAALVDGCGLNAASWRFEPALHLGTYAEYGHHDAAGVVQGAPGTYRSCSRGERVRASATPLERVQVWFRRPDPRCAVTNLRGPSDT
jgi:hypothetical protein